MKFLENKRALILGIASTRSIAYGIAQAMHKAGAQLAFTYQTEKLKERVETAAHEFNSNIVIPCDVTKDDEIASVFTQLKQHWPEGLDIIVHSVAYAPADQLEGDYVTQVNREGFRVAHDISSYSLAAFAKAGFSMMEGRNGSIVTMTYIGGDRVVPSYNVMGLAKASLEANVRYLANSLGPRGIRVNGVSAGPVKTLAAAGISDFKKLYGFYEKVAPLRRHITLEEVGNAAAFLCSPLASGITGEILYVDAGYHVLGVPMFEE